jgi:hypothetical protein
LTCVEREKCDETIDGGQEDDAFATKGDASRIETEAWRSKPSLMDGNTLKHF